MQSAPIARASYTWYASMMKSLRSTGSEHASRACCRNASLPWKKSLSVSTDRQAAPAAS